ncbi:hypothetical protein E3N88_26401 [Mikania micrantha]|uniref:TF-B3 domain-containing protein n=1 Tax=Mikania micrantha TaxID=192012 RepID=A0A5N6N8H4_9ASTR|nr:hypothetical protein E3N88_26401 [Mikania micrantha]
MNASPNLHSSESLISNFDPSSAVDNIFLNPLTTVLATFESMDPGFFKVVRYPSSTHMTIPIKWVENHCHSEEPPVSVLLKSYDGSLWKVKVVKINNVYSLESGLKSLIKHMGAKKFDILVFIPLDKNIWSITLFPYAESQRKLEHVFYNIMLDTEHESCHLNPMFDKEPLKVDFDDKNAEADEVHKIFTKTATSRFRLPIHVARMAGLDQNHEMRFVDLTGQETTVSVRYEKSGNYKRYIIGAAFWKDFMKKKNTISFGDNCTFDYNILDHTLSIVRVDKV